MSKKKPIKGFNDLETLFPEIAKEFHPTKNGDLKASDFLAHSEAVVWWLCPKGHTYDMMINSRTGTNASNCPICSGKRIVEGINDLSATNPEIIQFWDYEKNNKKPTEYGSGSNQYAFWKCEKGHFFRSRIYNMTHSVKGMNCPVCHNYIIVEGTNDLATTHPELINEWDYSKNILKPTEVHANTNKKVWWKCKKHGHTWDANIYSRAVMGLGCPICSNQRLLKGFNDLETLYPSITKHWNSDKNDNKPSDYIGTKSNKIVWFKCEHGHEWKSSICDFTSGKGCPVCANKRIEIGFNDLATTNPDLVKEWNYNKNNGLKPEMYTYGSDVKVWWVCKNGHEWPAAISSRVHGNGCPKCAKELQTSLPEKALFYYISKFFSDAKENISLREIGRFELDIYIPSLKLAIEYDGCNWHKNTKNDIKKDDLCNKNGIRLIRIREEGCPDYDSPSIKIMSPRVHSNIVLLEPTINTLIETINNLFSCHLPHIEASNDDIASINGLLISYEKSNSLASVAPQLLSEWDYEKNKNVNPDSIAAFSNKKGWWRCKNYIDHSWAATINSRVSGRGCPYCSNRYVLKGFNDLETRFPEIASEWDYEKNGELKPDSILFGSNKKVSWKCKKGHTWDAAISTRTLMGHNCPTCAGQKPIIGLNDLEAKYPELIKEWDYEKNGDLKPSDCMPGSEKVVWWICPKGHSYDMMISSRTRSKCKCPICNNKRVLKGYNDLETLHPEIAKEWDYEKNGELLPSQVGGAGGSGLKVWFKCKNGHSWITKISTRIKYHTGCPQCAIDKRRNK